ncbi:MAG TPA: replicative DNA helicase, partial [Sulfurovum sp.]|nr:replicative DNA helicase [Sulfurovum sp.]
MENMYNLNIERAVLSAIIFDPEILEDIAAKLKPHDFYLPFHQYMFESMEELLLEEKPVDEEFLRKRLHTKGKFDEVAMIDILSSNPISNTKAYLEEIKAKANKRALVTLATEIKKVTIEDDLDAMDVMNLVEKKLYEITQESMSNDFRESSEITLTMMDEINRMKELGNSKLVGVDTGFHNLNDKTSGFGKGDLVIIAARPAMGKCLGKGTKVLMYDGTLSSVEDVQVGDKLMGDDSTPRNVLSLARGQEDMYWVRQNKGVDYRVNKSHILSLKRSRNDTKHSHGDVLNIEVSDYIQKSDKFQSNYKGYKVAVDFKSSAQEIEPYFLGIWLGDDRSSDVRIATQDKEVVIYLEAYAQRLGKKLHAYKAEDKCPMYGITNIQTEGEAKNTKDSLQATLRQMGVLDNKHIPQNYISNSRENRLELLAGLIDSDGYYDKKHNVMEIVQKRESLSREIKYLADSLGFRVSLKAKQASIKSIGYECEVYRVRIVGDLDAIPTRIPRKQARALLSRRDYKHTGISVEYDKFDDYYGFVLDGNHLFLLEDMTVTHNTALVLNMALKAIERGEGVAFFSLEMPAEQLMLRALSAKTSIPLQALRVGDLRDEQWSQLAAAVSETSKQKLFADDGGYATIHHVRSKLRKLKAQNPE